MVFFPNNLFAQTSIKKIIEDLLRHSAFVKGLAVLVSEIKQKTETLNSEISNLGQLGAALDN